MQKLKFDSEKKEYNGVAFKATHHYLGAEIIVVAPSLALLKKYRKAMGGDLDPKLCKRLKVKIVKE